MGAIEKRNNDCGGSSFENRWRATAPIINDCRTLAGNIAGGGEWTQNTGNGQREIASFGTCHFGVEPNVNTGLYGPYKVGNEDVIDLIHSSIDMFQQNGRVASRGVMPCGDTAVLWGIYE